MRIAIPLADGRLSPHFGHCDRFAIVEADIEKGAVLSSQELPAPEHVPGLRPRWLHEQGVHLVIAGGMGAGAKALLADTGIQVITGAPAEPPAVILSRYLAGNLTSDASECDHSGSGGHSCGCGREPNA
jgi:ATP-binding protein involved in chromosome partitioning